MYSEQAGVNIRELARYHRLLVLRSLSMYASKFDNTRFGDEATIVFGFCLPLDIYGFLSCS
jgi:hypothetical protein